MPKYYVSSGDVQEVVQADDPSQAVRIMVNRAIDRENSLGLLSSVSEIGFNRYDNDSLFVSTVSILEEMEHDNTFFIDEEALERMFSKLDEENEEE